MPGAVVISAQSDDDVVGVWEAEVEFDWHDSAPSSALIRFRGRGVCVVRVLHPWLGMFSRTRAKVTAVAIFRLARARRWHVGGRAGWLRLRPERAQCLSFAADIAQHAPLRAARPEAVAEKKTAVLTRDKQVSLAWA
jgi:hypothetical protein